MSKAIQVERLLGAGAQPHILGTHSDACLAKLLAPGTLGRLAAEGFGAVHIHEFSYKNGPDPIHGRYEYRDPKLVADVADAIRAHGLKVVGYLHGPKWRAKGLSHIDALEEMCRHGWDGVYLDNAHISNNRDIMYDFCARLAGMFDPVIHHQSIKPFDPLHGKRAEHDGAWLRFFTHTRWGESNALKPTMRDFKWQVSQATREDTNALGMYMLPSMWWCLRFDPNATPQKRHMTVNVAEWMSRLPSMLCAAYCLFGWYEQQFMKHCYPAWRALQAQYEDDPVGVLARLPVFRPRWSWEPDADAQVDEVAAMPPCDDEEPND